MVHIRFTPTEKGKLVLVLFLSVCLESFSQNNSIIFNKAVNNSTINIVQNGDLKVFNLNDSKQLNRLRREVSLISNEFKEMMDKLEREVKSQKVKFSAADKSLRQNQEKINKKQDELKLQIEQLSRNIFRFLLPDTVSITLSQLENKTKEIEENKKNLETELEILYRNNLNDSTSFASARERLVLYDIDGYNKILSEIKDVIKTSDQKNKEYQLRRYRLFYQNSGFVKNIYNRFGNKMQALILELQNSIPMEIRSDNFVLDTLFGDDHSACMLFFGNSPHRVRYVYENNKFIIHLLFWDFLNESKNYKCVIMDDGYLEMYKTRSPYEAEKISIDQLILQVKSWILDIEAWKKLSNLKQNA